MQGSLQKRIPAHVQSGIRLWQSLGVAALRGYQTQVSLVKELTVI